MIIEAKALNMNLDRCEQELNGYGVLFREEGIALTLCCLTQRRYLESL